MIIAEIQCIPLTISTARGLELCSIMRKLHLCAFSRLSSSSLGKIGAEIAVLSWNNFYCQVTTTQFYNQETAPLRMRQTELLLSLKIGAEIAVFLGIISTVRGPQHCSINRKLHLCACSSLSSPSLGEIGAEIAVLSWKHFYCKGTTALFHNQETAPLRMLRLSSCSLGNIGAEIGVFPGIISTARGPQQCSIIRKLHLCLCDRQSSPSLGKIGAKIGVLSWNYF
jgi:hypothetical protein